MREANSLFPHIVLGFLVRFKVSPDSVLLILISSEHNLAQVELGIYTSREYDL